MIAYDGASQKVYESGAYDASTGVLTEDADVKIYETHPGLSPGLASALGLTAGKSFHFVLNDTIYSDNRIPPRGFTNANFETIQSPPVAYSYADSQYWDTTLYELPSTSEMVEVFVYYQSTSKEFIEFLRDENTTNTLGQDLYDFLAMVFERASQDDDVLDLRKFIHEIRQLVQGHRARAYFLHGQHFAFFDEKQRLDA